ncbi:MAG TPA: hypothetical protein VMF30_14030 [Pirellulales bacterium]|nr:hypothetical protein [Pirellulales bacterium]
MAETWLKTNRRALAFGLLLPALLAAIGIVLLARSEALGLRMLGWVLALVGTAGLALVARQFWVPRLAYDQGHLLVYLRSGPPDRVPIDVVEGFLLGQGPTMLPGRRYHNTEAATVVIRLAEAASDWADRETKPAFGRWCGGYITLRGTWCEPLSVDLVQGLNRRLHDAQHAAPGQANTGR